MKILKMKNFFIAIIVVSVAFVFSNCKEETSRQMESSSSTVTKESVKFRRISAKIDSNSNWYRRGKPIPGFNEERETTFFVCDSPVMSCFPGYPPVKNMYKGHVKIPSLSDIDLKNENGANRTASDVLKFFRQRTPGLRHVYRKHLKKLPGFQCQITLKFTIISSGEISDISIVSSTTQNREFDTEIQRYVSRWKFHKIKSGKTTVTIPLTFTE